MKRVSSTDIRENMSCWPGRQGDHWYVAAINATKEPLKLKLNLPMMAGKTVSFYGDDKRQQPQLQSQKIKNDGSLQVVIQPQGGAIWVSK